MDYLLFILGVALVSKQEQRPSSPLQQPITDKRTAAERVAGSSVASSGDSMEEMARRFEKVCINIHTSV